MAVSGTGQGETPQSLATPAFAGFHPIAENGIKAFLTTGMTTDRKTFQSHRFCAIIVQNQISGYSAVGSALDLGSRGRAFESLYSDQKPLKSADFRGFFLFLVYCGAGFEKTLVLLHNILYANELTVTVHSFFAQCMVLLKI